MPATARELDDVFGALASTARRRIVAHLTSGPATAPDIGRQFAFSKQALSRHLFVLEQAGIVERRLDGRVKRIALVPHRLTAVTRWSDDVIAAWSANLDRLALVLGDLDHVDDGDDGDDGDEPETEPDAPATDRHDTQPEEEPR